MLYPWDACPCDFHLEMKKEYFKFIEIKNKKNKIKICKKATKKDNPNSSNC